MLFTGLLLVWSVVVLECTLSFTVLVMVLRNLAKMVSSAALKE